MVSLVLVCVLAMTVFAIPASAESITGTHIYGSSSVPRSFYERVVELENGDLLATWCREFPIVTGWKGMKSFYFYKSSDNGATWTHVSTLDPSNYSGLSRDKQGMPGLFVLPQACGEFPAGTILFATNDWDTNNPYAVHIWRSTDNGLTWQKHGDLAPRNAMKTSVWEPEFAISADGRLVCYYSDEQQRGYDQCLVLEISDDGGLTWYGHKVIVGTSDPNWVRGVDPSMWRPGMPRVTRMTNGTYIMAYENICGGYSGQVSVIFSEDGINWGDPSKPGAFVTAEGTGAYQCPTIACIDDGSTYGRLFLRGMNDTCSPSQCYTSTDGGKSWALIDAPLTAIRDESKGSSWSGTFLAKDNLLIEVNNAYNGSYNEIRCGRGVLTGGQLIIDGADYKLVNAATGFCLDDDAGSLEWGNEMIVWHDNGLKTQSWKAENLNGDYFALVCNFSDLALDNPCGSKRAGERIRQWHVNMSPAESWKFIPAGDGTFRVQNGESGLYLDTEGQSRNVASHIIQNNYSESNTQKWRVERIYEITRLRSSNISDCHVYVNTGNKAMIANKSTSLSLSASEWRIVPGLADNSCISLESVKYPGYYLRHYNGQLIISRDDGSAIFKKDATWYMRDALDGSGGVSFESYNITGTYIRHCNSYLRIDPIYSDLDRRDASFHMILQ
jgi:hypothetical protein